MELRSRRAEPQDQFVHGLFIQALNDESNQQLSNDGFRLICQHAINSQSLEYGAIVRIAKLFHSSPNAASAGAWGKLLDGYPAFSRFMEQAQHRALAILGQRLSGNIPWSGKEFPSARACFLGQDLGSKIIPI